MMETRIGIDKRIYVTCSSPEEVSFCRSCDFLEKGPFVYSCEDTIVNRIFLQMPHDIAINPISHLAFTNTPLREYQQQDVRRMVALGSCLNANDMGLGKTLEAITYCSISNCNNVLVLAPKSVLYHWEAQFNKWAPQYRTIVLPEKYYTQPTIPTVTIINYERARKHNIGIQLVNWDVIICDEAHRIKNHKSQIGELIHKLRSKNRIALTGTPITNLSDDIFNILKWIEPKSVGDGYWHFVNNFCYIPYNPFGRVIEGLTQDPYKREVLKEVIDMFTIRRTKAEVMKDLPAKGVYDVMLEMDDKQKRLYKDTLKLVFEKLPPNLTIANAAIHLLRLIQITSNPQLYSIECKNPKFDYILDLLEDNPNKKIVVFSHFAQTVFALEKLIPNSAVVVGEKSASERLHAINKFLNYPDCRVLIGTIGAMGQGIDGLQYAANTVVFIDCDWSPQMNTQAEDRVHRSGQRFPVDVYYLRLNKTVDIKVGRVLELKESDVKEIFNYERNDRGQTSGSQS